MICNQISRAHAMLKNKCISGTKGKVREAISLLLVLNFIRIEAKRKDIDEAALSPISLGTLYTQTERSWTKSYKAETLWNVDEWGWKGNAVTDSQSLASLYLNSRSEFKFVLFPPCLTFGPHFVFVCIRLYIYYIRFNEKSSY